MIKEIAEALVSIIVIGMAGIFVGFIFLCVFTLLIICSPLIVLCGKM